MRWAWRGGALARVAILLVIAFALSRAGSLAFVWGVAQSLVAAAMVFIVEWRRAKADADRLNAARNAMRTAVDQHLARMDQALIQTIAQQGQLPLAESSKMLADVVQARETLLHALGAIEGAMPETAADIDFTTRRKT